VESKTGVLILAGGKSERMLFPKAFLMWKGKTFLKRIVDTYEEAGIGNRCVVLNAGFCTPEWAEYISPVRLRVTLVKNQHPERGRFYSLKRGIKKMPDPDFCFIQNVDNPFVDPELIRNLIEHRNPDGFTSPAYNGKRGHPVLISKKILQYIDLLEEDDITLRDVLSGFPVVEVEAGNEQILMNINTPADYEKCF
jgi:molybdenum cofactor cytidylyltransferase